MYCLQATKSEHAAIIVWDVSTWQQVQKLEAHSLTIVQMEFSHGGDYLLSVSRDRTWAIHHFDDETGKLFRMMRPCSISSHQSYF